MGKDLRGRCGQSVATALGLVLLMQASGARAQSTEVSPATTLNDPAEEEQALEEIVVTARKVSENVQDIPLTVNSVSGDSLENLGTPSVANIAQFVPNMTWDTGSTSLRNSITIRGIPSNQTFQGFDPGVGIYVDEVYQANGLAFNFALLDIERIEVLKGPQGTLFGRNTIAGAVSIVTRPPGDDPYVEGSLTLGNYDLRQVRGILNLPVVSDRLAVKAAFLYRNREGFQRNRVDRRRVNGEDQLSARLQMLLTPLDTLSILVGADITRDRSDTLIPDCGGPSAAGFGKFCADNNIKDRVVETNGPNRADRDMWGVSSKVDLSLAGADLVSITAFRDLKVIVDQDQDFTAFPALRGGLELPSQTQFSQELRFNSANATGLRWLAGLYFFHESKSPHIPIIFKREILNALRLPLTRDYRADTFARQRTSSYSAFGQVSYDLTSRLTGEIGLRLSRDEKEFTYEQQVEPQVIGLPGVPVVVPRTSEAASWDALSGSASLRFRPSEEVMLYARYARGHKSGGYNAGTANPGQLNTRPYDPEYVDNYELGFKTELFGSRVRFNGSAFYIVYDDIQIQVTNANRERFIDNAGKARSKGIEIELAAAPLKGLSLNVGAGLQDAEYTGFGGGATLDLTGKKIVSSPGFTATAAASYQMPLTGRVDLYLAANGAYRSDNYLNNTNTVEQQAYGILNARFGLQAADERWALHLFANNITDVVRNVDYGGGGFFYSQTADTIAPRTYGIELRSRF